jgi:hypothetical protein
MDMFETIELNEEQLLAVEKIMVKFNLSKEDATRELIIAGLLIHFGLSRFTSMDLS